MAFIEPMHRNKPNITYLLPIGQSAAISQTIFSNAFSWRKSFFIFIQISLKFVPINFGPINNTPALVQVMAGRRSGDKPLSEPTLTRFTEAYVQHRGRWVNAVFVTYETTD